jgi:hypothetical protein
VTAYTATNSRLPTNADVWFPPSEEEALPAHRPSRVAAVDQRSVEVDDIVDRDGVEIPPPYTDDDLHRRGTLSIVAINVEAPLVVFEDNDRDYLYWHVRTPMGMSSIATATRHLII